ncbi:MAG TPA: hypothetical protein VFY77_02460, partial [Nitrososphaeraceae archaeon]|nr:hypothetical protein [Nitrososphaeraceae archaeon]
NRTKNRAGRLLEKVFRKNTRYLNKKHNTKKIERQYLYIQYTESNLKYENIFTNPTKTKPMLMH